MIRPCALASIAESTSVLGLFSGIMALTATMPLLIPETKGRSLEEIEQGVLYGEAAPPASEADASIAHGQNLDHHYVFDR